MSNFRILDWNFLIFWNFNFRTPSFYDEIKINLPVDLNDGHHILFTFFHITCKSNKIGDEVKIPIGYSWIPLLKDERLQTGEFTLPIALEQLPQSYGYLSPDVNLPNVRWLEGHKPLFDVKLEAVTTVHTQVGCAYFSILIFLSC